MEQESDKQPAHGHGGLGLAPASDADSIDYIKQYIDASAESADRARFVLLVMITASVLTFVAMWNSRSESWLNSRLTVATDAQKFYDPQSGAFLRDAEALDRVVWPRFISRELHDRLPTQKEKDHYLAARRRAFDSANEFVVRFRFADLEHLRRYVEFLERTRTEKVLSVTVPFFGIVFDINDLGMFAGLTFVIVLLLFRFSLLRELRNVRLVFRQAKTVKHLELCYDMLAMQQVLTTPPQLEAEQLDGSLWSVPRWRELFWTFIPKALFLLPFLAHLRIFIHDLRTWQEVESVYPGTVTSLQLSGIFLGLNVLLTGLCIYLGWKVDRTWKNHARYIVENRDPARKAPEPEPRAQGLLPQPQTNG